jgi:toxic anion resistance family protein
LISTFDEVIKIQDEGRQKRKEAEAELRNIENEMRTKLLEISNRQANSNR